MKELLPCALCGNPDVDNDEGCFHFPARGRVIEHWAIQCGTPGCVGIEAPTREEVVRMWNTRHTEGARVEAREAIAWHVRSLGWNSGKPTAGDYAYWSGRGETIQCSYAEISTVVDYHKQAIREYCSESVAALIERRATELAEGK